MNDYKFSMLSQLFEESEVMAAHALGSGKRVPEQVIEDLVCSGRIFRNYRKLWENDENSGDSEPAPSENVENVGDSETAPSENGENVGDSEPKPSENDLKVLTKQLSRVHGQLTQIVAPALPQTLKLIHDEKVKTGRWGQWSLRKKIGSVPLVQNMVIAALISLAGFFIFTGIASAIDPAVNVELSGWTKFEVRIVNLLILLCAAGLGASYLALYQSNRFVVEGTFDTKYNSSYWIRFVLGLISGVILAEVISQTGLIPQTEGIPPAEVEFEQFGKIVLALIGGFSASVVYRILTRLVEAIESMFLGDESERIAAKEQAAKAKIEEQNAQERLEIGADLMKLSQQIESTNDIEKTKEEINKIFARLMPFDSDGF